MEGCTAHGAKTTTAAAGQCPYSGATAGTTTAAAAGDCAAHGTKTAAAGTDGCCAGKGTTSATTAAAMKSGSSCSMHGATTTAAAAGAGCGTQGAKSTSASHGCPDHNVSAMAAGLGSNCDGHEKSGAAAHMDCDACDDLSTCDAELQAAGATMQTVPIKNGVMFVYTAKAAGGVNAIQSVMSRRTEHLSRIVSSGSKARLCDDCKSMRGAMASGRLVREVVNIEGGALVLVTSVDPTLVKRIRDLADASKMAVKS
jgi:hypothetical protein